MATYTSKYTGAQIDAAVAATSANATDITALQKRVAALEESGGGSDDSGSSGGSAASLNLWNYATTVLGQISADGSVNTDATAYCTTDFIPFTTGEKVYVYLNNLEAGTCSILTPSEGNAATLALYDSSKNLIASYYAVSGQLTSLPYAITEADVAYIRWGLNAAHWQNTQRQYGIFKREITADEFDVYSEGSSGGSSGDSSGGSTGGTTGTGCECTSSLEGKSILNIGDSLSATGEWQKQLTAKGAIVTTHALGGAGLIGMINGVTNDNGTLAALSVDDVSGKDVIILFGGTNNMSTERGEVGDSGGSETVVTSLNQWDYDATVSGYFGDAGVIDTSATDYVVTDFIPFVTGESVYVYLHNTTAGTCTAITPSEGNAAYLVLYDADKNFVAEYTGIDGTLNNPHTITEENVAYIRFGLNAEHFNNAEREYGIFKQEMTVDTFDVYSATELFSTGNTVASYMQYAINRIYALLAEAGNLGCRLMVITPFCFGASPYNEDAFSEDGVGLAQVIEDVAAYNGVPVYNAYKRSGINPTTLALWGASTTDRLHLNADGYAHLGKLIAKFAEDNVPD